ncbi:NEDD8-activating enzyme E1 catalytic subunit-like [Ischnura elegans]|uniref:NEDD8-activating enzyme E1 catalytic subunit-like n=1 Tax=Ischnura elegans TaxID=197161 RepID=UPI001ED86983|nr:NEDD8-activating enzyme E1 catalytic subunit-like [Ischnura elegans]
MHSRDSVAREGNIGENPHSVNVKKRKLEVLHRNRKEVTAGTQRKKCRESGKGVLSAASPSTSGAANMRGGGCGSGEKDPRSDPQYHVHRPKFGDARSTKDHTALTGGRSCFPRKWMNLSKILTRSGPFVYPNFKPSSHILEKIKKANILIVGAGGLGCEILKNLAMMGFENLSIIDMDKIDVSNLNRQFLFRREDVGRPKAEVAAEYISKRVFGCQVRSYYSRIEDFDQQFYQSFQAIICGLDSIKARNWLNGMVLSILTFDGENDEINYSSVIPLVDGGTEGFKGNSRVIQPGISPCIDCTINLYPPQTKFPLCTLASTPRLPEHCIEYAKLILWPRSNPWGKDTLLDKDDPQHLEWIYEKSLERAVHYGIKGLNYALVEGVLKNVIPAVASTNSVIGAACATEVFKIITHSILPMRNHLYFNNMDGVYAQCHELEREEECSSCANVPYIIEEDLCCTLENLINTLRYKFKVKNPCVRAFIKEELKMLYMPSIPAIEKRTRGNLNKSLREMGFEDATELIIADSSMPKAIRLTLKVPRN